MNVNRRAQAVETKGDMWDDGSIYPKNFSSSVSLAESISKSDFGLNLLNFFCIFLKL